MGDLPEGGAAAALRPLFLHSTSFAEPNPLEIRTANWATADRVAGEIIRKVQPTSVSEEKRREVVDYIQRLIKNFLGAEVFLYGSVPLKTYLPEGDLDFTAFGGAHLEDTFVYDMKTILEDEERNMAAPFVVKDVQLIQAEVKLVKCIVQGIVVDVSFNQIGGLSTLCFLEQIDRLIGEDHLFKRSIILIKAWCFYESRILGAHHGLISTYALETLVLYIFHLFHSTLDGPLAVLYKFLDYFSKFDWDNYCISLNGPVHLSSLPALIAEQPEVSDRDLLLSNDFLSSCVGKYSVPSRTVGRNSHGFQRKHLNIVDPLREANNLGRSVSKGSFYRIRSAFSYGTRKLEQIFSQPEDCIAFELYRFFSNTLARRRGGLRSDVQGFEPPLIYNRPFSNIDNFDQYYDEHAVSNGDFQSNSGNYSQDLLRGTERTTNMANGEQSSNSTDVLDKSLGLRVHGDSTDLATSGLAGLKISTNSSIRQSPSQNESGDAIPKPHFAPHLYFSNSTSCDGGTKDKSPGSDKIDNREKNTSSFVSSGSNEETVSPLGSLDRGELVNKDPHDPGWDHGSATRSEMPESLNPLDLTGDYESYLQYLQYGRWCYEFSLGMHSLHVPAFPATPYQNNIPWDGFLLPSHFKQNGFSHQHHNGFHPSPPLFPIQPVLFPGITFGQEELPKPRGTGTYFPNMNQPPQGYRSSSMKRRPSRSPHNNGRSTIFQESHMLDRSRNELSTPLVSCDSHPSFAPHADGCRNANGFFIPPEGVIQFESAGASVPEKGQLQRSVSSSSRTL
ncbi:Polynucleotide adenylyltransferase [Handroanthus impetiginosus]|uniref:Polynucleotide adenylyltransferase n=1 Tax=Handroanthus impetiginosus TaxID=429701 RepID=A0A2G9GT52_9LAMI|nr:Polynucleotide adenylyltransferase [Handroanthus impetiginosus]